MSNSRKSFEDKLKSHVELVQPKPVPVCEVFNFSEGSIHELKSDSKLTMEKSKQGATTESNRLGRNERRNETKGKEQATFKSHKNSQNGHKSKDTSRGPPQKLVYVPNSNLPMLCKLDNEKHPDRGVHMQSMVQLPAKQITSPREIISESTYDFLSKPHTSDKYYVNTTTEVDWDEIRSKMATRAAESRASSLNRSSPISMASTHADEDIIAPVPWPGSETQDAIEQLSHNHSLYDKKQIKALQEITFQPSPGDPFKLPIIDRQNNRRQLKNVVDQRIEEKFEETLKIYKRTREKIMNLDMIREKQRQIQRSPRRRRRQFPEELNVQRIEGSRPVEMVTKSPVNNDSFLHQKEDKNLEAERALHSQKSKMEPKPEFPGSPTKLPPIAQKSPPKVKSKPSNNSPPSKSAPDAKQRKMFMESDYDQFSHRKLKSKSGTPRTPRTKHGTQNQISKPYDRNQAMQYINVKIANESEKRQFLMEQPPLLEEDIHDVEVGEIFMATDGEGTTSITSS